MNTQQLNKARALYYGLFSSLFSFIDNTEKYENIQNTINLLSQNPLDEYSDNALKMMKIFLQDKGQEGLQEENNDVFFSPSTSFIPTTASYYSEDRDDGQKRVEMTNLVLKSKFRKDNENFKEAEDHVSFIFSFLQTLIEQDFSENKNDLVNDVYLKILNDVIDLFIGKLYSHESSVFYKETAILLKVFIELERAYLNIKTNNNKVRNEEETYHRTKKNFKKKDKRNFDKPKSL
ncbi:molecular chaperone TorD family protein [Arcobacter sp. KX21116]|uniref:TorD/DmsD family molecular chaperone n=1 Tax=Arcobacter iocasae TaxID=2906515 RepID=UPI0035D417AA